MRRADELLRLDIWFIQSASEKRCPPWRAGVQGGIPPAPLVSAQR